MTLSLLNVPTPLAPTTWSQRDLSRAMSKEYEKFDAASDGRYFPSSQKLVDGYATGSFQI